MRLDVSACSEIERVEKDRGTATIGSSFLHPSVPDCTIDPFYKEQISLIPLREMYMFLPILDAQSVGTGSRSYVYYCYLLLLFHCNTETNKSSKEQTLLPSLSRWMRGTSHAR
jgi:hypothetical protein